jgi:hypothetical protein
MPHLSALVLEMQLDDLGELRRRMANQVDHTIPHRRHLDATVIRI